MSRGPAAAAGRTPPLILVAGLLAVEWPMLGMDLRQVEMALSPPPPLILCGPWPGNGPYQAIPAIEEARPHRPEASFTDVPAVREPGRKGEKS